MGALAPNGTNSRCSSSRKSFVCADQERRVDPVEKQGAATSPLTTPGATLAGAARRMPEKLVF